MPEYLAPAVYVEETSFRSKSIEGVATSTTGFAGPTVTGPHDDTPELLTSFADFQRIYGGFEPLDFGRSVDSTNFLAHAVRAYFDEGGSRLYLARVLPAGASAAEVAISGLADAKFVARFPGQGRNRRIRVREVAVEAPVGAMRRAPDGAMARVAVAESIATPAKIVGAEGQTFEVSDGKTLKFQVTVGAGAPAAVTMTFKAKNAELFAAAKLAATTTIDGTNDTLQVELNGKAQTVVLTHGLDLSADAIVADLNRKLRGGYARLSDTNDDPDSGQAGRLVIGTDRAGTAASIEVANANVFGLPVDAPAQNAFDLATNNVGDLAAVTDGDINSILTAMAVTSFTAALEAGKIVFATAEGMNTLQVLDGTANAAFGLEQDATSTGSTASPASYLYVKVNGGWTAESGGAPVLDSVVLPADEDKQGDTVKNGASLLTVTVLVAGNDNRELVYEGVGVHEKHPRFIGNVLGSSPSSRAERMTRPVAVDLPETFSAFALRSALLSGGAQEDGFSVFELTGGSDGSEPTQEHYKAALDRLGAIEDISIVAAPGSSAYQSAQATRQELIKHAEKRRSYRIAVLDTPPNHDPSEARTYRSQIDSKYAALYYPWVVVANPLAKAGDESIPKEIALPPSGFVCGIYARNDIERGVFKAPANEVVRSALRFATDVNFAQQEVLNPLGVNCLRFFPGRGYRVWGARTASSDPEWKYVNIRRYFNYLERSIDVGTQWAVFEPNGERLWANIRETISSFLYNEWKSGALLGSDPKEAYFVRCDRSTMTQDDLDNGRLICLIGVAAVKPAEFVIFRIGQKTTDSRN